MTGSEALFALIGIRMMKLSQVYNRKLDELHSLFYRVSCDWDRLEQVLQEQKEESMDLDQQTPTWTLLEDLAARDDKSSEAYRHIVEQKGLTEVKKRR